jgi:hypothetical protein
MHVEEDLVDCFRITRVMFNFGCNQRSWLIEDTKNNQQWKTLKRNKEQRSKELLCGCNGVEFVYCPAAKENSNDASLMVFKVHVNRASP